MGLVSQVFSTSSTVALLTFGCQFRRVRGKVALATLSLFFVAADARATAPIYDPMTLNIGINCHWQQSCQRKQANAMNDARKFIDVYQIPLWRIHLCNKNARRGPARLDWIGFNACIRNPQLAPTPVRPRRH
jgi:hypothetical protein